MDLDCATSSVVSAENVFRQHSAPVTLQEGRGEVPTANELLAHIEPHFSEYLLDLGHESPAQVFDIILTAYVAGKVTEIIFPNDPYRKAINIAKALGHDPGKARDPEWRVVRAYIVEEGETIPLTLLSAEYRATPEEFANIIARHPEYGAIYWTEYFERLRQIERYESPFDRTWRDSVLHGSLYHHSISPMRPYPIIPPEQIGIVDMDLIILNIADHFVGRSHILNLNKAKALQIVPESLKVGRKYSATTKDTPWNIFERMVNEYINVDYKIIPKELFNPILRDPRVLSQVKKVLCALNTYLESPEISTKLTHRIFVKEEFIQMLSDLTPELRNVIVNQLGLFQ